MSDHTHIEFTKIPSKVNLLVNGTPAVINTKYTAGSVFSVTKKNSSDVGIPFESFRYKAYKNEIVSKEATIQVDLLTQNSIPQGTDTTFVILNNSDIDLSSHISINNSSDRIIIESFDFTAGDLLLNEDQIVNTGDIIMKYDIENLMFRSFTGTGMPYQKIIYRAANSQAQALSSNFIQMNIPGIAEYKIGEYTANKIENVIERYLTSKITNARINKKALISFKIKLDEATAWPVGNNNEIILSANGFTKRYTENTDEEIEIQIDEFGNVDIQMNMSFVQEDFPDITGNVTITLLSIDDDPYLVSSTNNNININFIDTP